MYPRISWYPRDGCRLSAATSLGVDHQRSSSGSSSLGRLSGEQIQLHHHHLHENSNSSNNKNNKSPLSSSSTNGSGYLHQRRRSDCTETGSIGYGSSAPLESEASYSSHQGYPPTKPSTLQIHSPCRPATNLPVSCLTESQLCQRNNQQNHQQQAGSSGSQTSSPSSGAYVDVSSSTRITPPINSGSLTVTSGGSGGGKRPRAALVNSNNNKANVQANTAITTTAWNNGPLSPESETGYVVDTESGHTYCKGQLLGKGGFARVYLITDIASKKKFACKIISKHQMQKIHIQKVAREIKIHKELNHINVVKMHHYFEDSLNVYMLLEACPKKSLVHVLKYRGKVTEPEARYYMRQMVSGVAYIHSQGVVHRDLKPGNMFLSDRMIVKIGDFGLATQPDGHKRRVTICGTPNFIAPEVLNKQAYSFEADVWALGCILYALLTGQPPFDSSTLKETYSRICGHRYRELDDGDATRNGQELVKWLLEPNPQSRPSLEMVKQHAYLSREYVPDSLPDSCCYQAPNFHLVDRPIRGSQRTDAQIQVQPNSFNITAQRQQRQLAHAVQANTNDQSQPQQQSNSKKSKGKKKKVSSWLASWKLPRLPRLRQRISNVLCLEPHKKQLQSGALGMSSGVDPTSTIRGGIDLPIGASARRQSPETMCQALEECLAICPRSAKNPNPLHGYAPLFVTKWIDYSNKYGLTFQLSDRSVGVLFNDSTKMSYTHDRRRVEYVTMDDELTVFSREKNVPAYLHEKLELLRHFTDYMDKHLTEGGEIMTDPRSDGLHRSSKNSNVPVMRRWLRTSKAIVLELNVPLLQMNFFEDHTKLIISQDPQIRCERETNGYLVTYIDCERRACTYWLSDLRDYGCTPELHDRLLYIYKVSKEFANLDNVQGC
ncbi:hypothetical protein QAD02_018665 [Eretmocerus hayati]|uniref:Uncharacterized protein n=1 Tax=Eretmocerus hayati TaxID=131215 RepID=A0ACC2PIK5_9HYME|nr:hypothetical protein QAD02_018665 [Eretmocerus hayati]